MKGTGLTTTLVAGLAAFFVAVGGVSAQQEATQGAGQVTMLDQRFIVASALGNRMEIDLSQMAAQRGASDAVRAFAQRLAQDHQRNNQELQSLATSKGITLPPMVMMDMGAPAGTTQPGAPGQNNGTLRPNNGTLRPNNGTLRPNNGGQIQPNGTQVQPNGTQVQPNGAQVQPNGALQPNGTQVQPNGTQVQPNGMIAGMTPAMMDQLRQLNLTYLPVAHRDKRMLLSNLSGPQFDEVWVGEQVKHHAATVADCELHAQYARDADVRAYAARSLPMLREHYQMARALARLNGAAAVEAPPAVVEENGARVAGTRQTTPRRRPAR